MNDSSESNTKRLAKNTLILYARMLFSLLVSLYSSRLILAALGDVDYGLYNVVGGFVSMFSIVTSSLSSSMGRFLTFELGKGNQDKLKHTFSISVEIEIALAVLVFLLVETVGVWFLNNKMVIPSDRVNAANWVLQFSLLSFILSLLIVPYDASIISHERMDFFAFVSIFDVCFKLLIALLLAKGNVSSDKLILYGFLLVVGQALVQVLYRLFCRRNFNECHFLLCFDKLIVKDMLSFASWNFLGVSASILGKHGVNIILNIFVGPAVNAARGLAQTVANVLANFVNNFTMALRPQITKAYANEDLDYTRMLVYRGGRFSFFIFFILAFPIIVETDFILNLWLVDVPDHTVSFVRLVLLVCIVDILSNILGMAQIATGKVKYYQIVTGSLTFLNFALSYVFLRLGFKPEVVYVVAIVIAICNIFVCLFFVKYSLCIKVRIYFKEVFLKIIYVLAVSIPVPLIIHSFLPAGWYRFILVCSISMLCCGLSSFFLGCSCLERKFILSYCKSFLNKFKMLVS